MLNMQHILQGIEDLVEAACGTLFLCEADNAEWITLSVLDDSHNFSSN